MKKRVRRPKSRKKTRVFSHKSLTYILVILFILTGVFAYIYSNWQYISAIKSLQNEYNEILKQQEKKEQKGEVLSITVPQTTISVEYKKKLPIIMYHYVEVVQDPGDTIRKSLNINPYIFERQLKDLKDHNYETYFVRDIPSILKGGVIISTRSAVLSFDDGYEDFYYYAFPLLKKYNIKSTMYVIYNFIGRKGFLNKKQLDELVKSGIVEIGSHTLDHVYLSQVAVPSADQQIRESKKLLSELLNIRIETFAYPFGGYNDQVAAIARDAGYTAAVSVIPGSLISKDNVYFLPRYRAGMFSDRMVAVLESLKK